MSPLDLPPDLRGRLRRLSLRPLRPTVLLGAGAHDSRNRGSGLEFAQYRAYERGDDLRRIDWKLYARSDKFFVRDAERESPVAIWLVLDASASMGQADLARPNWSRFDAARRLAACVMEIALREGDRFGLIVESAEGPMVVDPGEGVRNRDRLRSALSPLAASGVADWTRDIGLIGQRIGPHDLTLILSDGFDEGCIAAASRLAAAGRDVSLIQILTGDERDFPFDQGYRFNDPETGAQLVGDGPAMRRDFIARFTEARAALANQLAAHQVRHVEHFIDEPADRPLAALFRPAGRA
jgi:uncharacterized protein (DUF58 family)